MQARTEYAKHDLPIVFGDGHKIVKGLLPPVDPRHLSFATGRRSELRPPHSHNEIATSMGPSIARAAVAKGTVILKATESRSAQAQTEEAVDEDRVVLSCR